MATLKKRRGLWYARVRWYNQNGMSKDKQVPLRTDSKVTALERLSAVTKVESDIKDGIAFSFPWLNDDGLVKVVRKSLSDVISDFMSFKKLQGLANSSILRLSAR